MNGLDANVTLKEAKEDDLCRPEETPDSTIKLQGWTEVIKGHHRVITNFMKIIENIQIIKEEKIIEMSTKDLILEEANLIGIHIVIIIL